ncbi:MAG: type II secretion system protein GspG [Planctomycetaceae bacterium]
MTMVVPKILGRQQHANADATRISMGGLTQALKLYSLDHAGEFPAMTDGFDVLLKSPGARDPRWRGPYLDEEPRDAWGSLLRYQFPGQHNADSFDISSPGVDRVFGTADDLGNWDDS